MILITCPNGSQPADFLMAGQDMTTYELLGFSNTGAQYTGDFNRFRCSTGASNQLGTYDQTEDISAEPILTLTEASIREQFNAWQDSRRELDYSAESDRLLMEAWRKEIDPKSDVASLEIAKNVAIAKVDEIKLRHLKV